MEPLPDPCNDRVISDLPAPPHLPLTTDVLFPSGGDVPNWGILRDHLAKEGVIDKLAVIKLVTACSEVMKKEPTLTKLPEPIVIVGDIHGQYYDLLHMLEKAGDPSKINYLFLGDYVDRGIFGVEVLLLLYAIKLNFPTNTVLLRGNHEC